jgi:predicted HTH domain antitoxin
MVLQIDLPETVQLNEFELKMSLAASLFDRGVLSSGQAADLVNVSKRTFLEVVGSYGVSIFQYEDGELEEELNAL